MGAKGFGHVTVLFFASFPVLSLSLFIFRINFLKPNTILLFSFLLHTKCLFLLPSIDCSFLSPPSLQPTEEIAELDETDNGDEVEDLDDMKSEDEKDLKEGENEDYETEEDSKDDKADDKTDDKDEAMED